MSLVLKSNVKFTGQPILFGFVDYVRRVQADGGVIVDEQAVRDAFSFVQNSSIASQEVFVACSLKWGVKYENEKPIKLYSLYNESGDMDLLIGNATYMDYTLDTDVPVINFKSVFNNSNGLQTVGSVSGVETSGICIVSKVPALSDGPAYGSALVFTKGELVNLRGESNDNRVAAFSYRRETNSDMPTDWFSLGYAYGGRTLLSSKTLTNFDATGWDCRSFYVGKDSASILTGSDILQSDSMSTTEIVKDDISMIVGRGRGAVGTYQASLYADVAEIWGLVNTTQENIQSVSAYAESRY